MASRLNPYLGFDGNAREAVRFYERVFGGTVAVSTYGEYGDPSGADADRVMHAQLETETGFTLMVSDVPPGSPHNPGDAFAVSLSGDDADELRGSWAQLAEGGNVTMALERQTWGDEFGMCIDRFGVPWMVNITQSAS